MNELNTNLIEAAKEKFPAKGQLANILMDTLYMGKEAIYRRLRGEVPFTFQEAAIISKELGISLDRIAGVSFSNNAMFDINVVDHGNPFETYYDFLNKHVKLFHTLREDPNASLGTASNVIPQTLYLKHELLAKFRFFKWMYQNEHIKCKHFRETGDSSKDNQCPARFCETFCIIFILPITFGTAWFFFILSMIYSIFPTYISFQTK